MPATKSKCEQYLKIMYVDTYIDNSIINLIIAYINDFFFIFALFIIILMHSKIKPVIVMFQIILQLGSMPSDIIVHSHETFCSVSHVQLC